MAQIKIYGLRDTLTPIKAQLSDVIHACVVKALKFPLDKRAHRFFPLERDDFYYPAGRTDQYIIIEIMMIEGRTVETKKHLIRLLFERIHAELGLALADIEIAIMEAPKTNWGFRGKTGDEVELTYKVEV
jgi:4-oxalocrotonate tautomerase family enzyme